MGLLGDVIARAALWATSAVLETGNPRLLRSLAARYPVAPDWVARVPRLVLVGPGGSGKSTLLKQLLARAAADGRVPVWLPLAALPAEGALTPERLLEQLAEQARTQLGLKAANTAFFEALLQQRRLTLALDALDECGSLARRQKVRNLVDEIAGRWSGCQILLSSRPEALRETPLPLLDAQDASAGGFLALEIQPFTRDDVAPFLAAAFDDGAALAERLLARHDLDALLHTPLTLVLVGLVARSGHGLPAGRTPLFARCVETVCDTWEDAKDAAAADGLDSAQRVDVLRRLGWAAQRAAGQPLTPRAARDALAAAPGIGAARALAVLDGFARRNLLLHAERAAAGGTGLQALHFAHAQFREYLAGAHIAEQWALDAAATEAALAPHWFDGSWSEVLGFALDSLAAEPALRDSLLAAAWRAADAHADLLHRAPLRTAQLLAGVAAADPTLVAAVVSALEALAAGEAPMCDIATERLLGLAAHGPAWPALQRVARGEGAGAAWADAAQAGEFQRLEALRGRLRAVEALAAVRGAAAVLPLLDAQPAAGRDAALTVSELRHRLGDVQAAVGTWRTLFDGGDGADRRAIAGSMRRAGEHARFADWLAQRLAQAPATLDDLLLAGELELPLDLEALWQPLLAHAQLELAALPEDQGFAPEGLSALIYALMSPAGSRAAALPAGQAVARAALAKPALVWYVGPQLATIWPALRAEAVHALGAYVRRSLVEPERVHADFSRQNVAVQAIVDEPDDALAVPLLLALLDHAGAARGRSHWLLAAAGSLGRRGHADAAAARLRVQLRLPEGVDDAHPDARAPARGMAWLALQELGAARLPVEADALYRSGEPAADAQRLASVWHVSGVDAVARAWFEALAAQAEGRLFLQALASLDPDTEAGDLAGRVLHGEADAAPEPRPHWGPAEAEAAFRSALAQGHHVDANDQETTSTVADMLGLLDDIDAAAAPGLVDRWVAQCVQAGGGPAAATLSDVLHGLSLRGWTSPSWPDFAAAVARAAPAHARADLLHWLWDHA